SMPPSDSHLSEDLPICLYFVQHQRRTPTQTLFPYTTLFRSENGKENLRGRVAPSCCYLYGSAAHPAPERARKRESDLCLSGERRSEEHTSELQSRFDLVCRLLLEKKNT